ncbi:nucleotide-diphospho-sugar transferase [Dacryopinax primogenitus]|uniref:Nucleotide-diphospho-sugar transferase n=1 Tax=Dacryopinax primogenitus (strain DJM 731) TaxID=1858805 RepID=M5G425_DACPD|nr:nucleotide-diphospho-sugar transferase [Dacryopinax primogenitus]EJU03429.1 nucleotide-diphospho-sugar transferase [Dacryopinax primogenitus]
MFSVSSTLRVPVWARQPTPSRKSLFSRTHLSLVVLLTTLVLLAHLYLSHHARHIVLTPSPIPRRPAFEGCAPTSIELAPRANGAILLLVREGDLPALLPTLRNFEHRFNARFKYPYVFLSAPDEPPFSPHFRASIADAVHPGALLEFGQVPEEHWRIPEWLDEDEIRAGFLRQAGEGVQYGGREGYHHMCRFYSGLFARHELLQKYEWYWRLEPGVRFYCSVTYDPFRFLAQRNQTYGFVITLIDDLNTIPSLYKTVKQYVQEAGLTPTDMWDFFTRDKNGASGYNRCHFWTNFEIGHLPFFRSQPYQQLFTALDRSGGFYTERWGDAPIRTIALGLLEGTDKVHYFEDFAYRHDWFMHCPERKEMGCDCDCPAFDTDHVDIDGQSWGSCVPEWKDISSVQWREKHPLPLPHTSPDSASFSFPSSRKGDWEETNVPV